MPAATWPVPPLKPKPVDSKSPHRLRPPGSKGWKREELHITADHVDIEALLAEHERREKEAARRAALLQLGRKDAKDAKGKGKKEGAQKRAGGEGPALGSSPRSLGRSIYHTY